MLDTYVKNRGSTKTFIHNNNHSDVNEINWDADYDGNYANISLDLNQNGLTKHFDIKLNNNDLADILNIPSVNLPIHERLADDYNYQGEQRPTYPQYLKDPSFYTHISSPLQNEELFVPLSINKKTLDRYTLTPTKHHKKLRTHKTHRFYKHPVSSKRTKSNRGKGKARRNVKSITHHINIRRPYTLKL
jgi:hypothetical protein